MAINKCVFSGNLTKDPEKVVTANGVSVCKFTIAVQRNFKNGSGSYEADFFNIVAWRSLADTCAQYLTKGRKVLVVCSAQSRSYKDNNGAMHYVTDYVASEVEFLTPKGETPASNDDNMFSVPPNAEFEEIGKDDDLPF